MAEDKANLGLATTDDLLRELCARGEVMQNDEGMYLRVQAEVLRGTLTVQALAHRTVDDG